MQQDDMGFTEMAFNQQQNAGDEFLLVRFMIKAKQNARKTMEEGRPIYEDLHYIEMMAPGNKENVVCRPMTANDKVRFPKHYEAFMARQDQDAVEGTMLSEWPGVTRSQVEELQYFKIRTVEQLANVADSNLPGMMGIVTLKQKAKTYLDSSKDNAAATALEAANAKIGMLMERLEALENVEPPKKRRKRRTPAQMEAARQAETELDPQE